ncbi:MAG: deoxyribonuclease IV [Bryobacteraceae bacterium]
MRIGIHTSISGALAKAAERAAGLRANTFQIFSTSPRMWRASTPDPGQIKLLRRARERHDLNPLAVHDNYLINLASLDPLIRERSVGAFRSEIERAIAIGAEYLVAHPGNYRGQTLEEGIIAVVSGIAEATRGIRSRGCMILLENTAGSGCQIGSRLEELAVIRQLCASQTDFPIGYCLDTAHCIASGYDIATPEGLRKTVSTANAILGLDNVPVIHTNDSKVPLNSRVDRHQHIGEGYIGLEGFRRILAHPKLRKKAFILETPIDKEGDDRRNIETLKNLCRKSSTTIKKSS